VEKGRKGGKGEKRLSPRIARLSMCHSGHERGKGKKKKLEKKERGNKEGTHGLITHLPSTRIKSHRKGGKGRREEKKEKREGILAAFLISHSSPFLGRKGGKGRVLGKEGGGKRK